MKWGILFFLFVFSTSLFATTVMVNCPFNQIRVWSPLMGYSCVPRMQNSPADCVICHTGQFPPTLPYTNWFTQFPPAIYQPAPMPWWASQGNLYYPNLHYPGAWNQQTHQMNPYYYPGQGEVFAAKPNVYVESIHQDKKFIFSFAPNEELSFLATTPYFDEEYSWKGKVVNKDRFEMNGINYDYLFYDIRLPKEKMQFERGVCALREDAIKWMLQDLSEMKYPAIALQDFEEHWKVKIPDYPVYCIYPQYNQQLNAALPVNISLDHFSFTRSLYVLIAHKSEPDTNEPQSTPLPMLDPVEIRPAALIKHETMFKEWGVAFLGE